VPAIHMDPGIVMSGSVSGLIATSRVSQNSAASKFAETWTEKRRPRKSGPSYIGTPHEQDALDSSSAHTGANTLAVGILSPLNWATPCKGPTSYFSAGRPAESPLAMVQGRSCPEADFLPQIRFQHSNRDMVGRTANMFGSSCDDQNWCRTLVPICASK
jgi:hypothetical protein